MRCDERRDPILLWVMGQLEGSPDDELRGHVQSGCLECAGYVAEARELRLGLLLAPDPAEPSPSLERRLRELVASTDAVDPAGPQPRARPPWRWAAAAALTAFLVGALGYRLGSADPRAVAVAAEGRSEGLLEESSEQVELLRASDVQRVQLGGTSARPEASASMFWQWEEGYYCYLHARGLSAPEGDGVYALWMENESGERILVGSFRPDARGQGVVWAKLTADAGRAARALVTLEKVEPGQEPTVPILLASS